jgi:hypothetical protein
MCDHRVLSGLVSSLGPSADVISRSYGHIARAAGHVMGG